VQGGIRPAQDLALLAEQTRVERSAVIGKLRAKQGQVCRRRFELISDVSPRQLRCSVPHRRLLATPIGRGVRTRGAPWGSRVAAQPMTPADPKPEVGLQRQSLFFAHVFHRGEVLTSLPESRACPWPTTVKCATPFSSSGTRCSRTAKDRLPICSFRRAASRSPTRSSASSSSPRLARSAAAS
jgi:hypothetical protein